MNKQPFVVAIIAKDAVEQLPVVVPAHELMVLAAVHGQDRVNVDESADLPEGMTEFEFDPQDEFARLEQKYGNHKDSPQSYASLVFQGFGGFEDHIENESVGTPKKPGRKAKAAKTTDED